MESRQPSLTVLELSACCSNFLSILSTFQSVLALGISVVKCYYLWLFSPCGPWQLFQFLNLHTIGRTPWTGISP
jgi:hypothetical protein